MELNPQPEAPRPKSPLWANLFVLAVIVAGIVSLLNMGSEWHQPFRSKVEINLSPLMLPYYTMLSFLRGVVAYGLSFVFTLWYARWAAYDRQAERFLIPLLDILQSIPLAAFLTPIEIFLVALFPHSNVGLELTCIIVIFTGQVWNMTFSFYYSLKGLPDDFAFVGKLARFTTWQRFTQIELPFAAKGLVYNSMVSMAGGWFFLSIIEAFQLGDQDYRVKGLGSYMSVAKEQHNGWAQVYAVIAVIIMIVAIDQLIWRPLIVWSNRFKIEDTESEFQDESAVLRFLSRSTVFSAIGDFFSRFFRPKVVTSEIQYARPYPAEETPRRGFPWSRLLLVPSLALIAYGAWCVLELLWAVKPGEWLTIGIDLLLTLVRVLAAVALSTLIAVPVGVWIGSSPRLARYLMPLTQIAASFPSPLVFSNLFALIVLVGGNLQWGSVILMMLGTIWYILFNVISGASAVPQDLRACTQLTHLSRWQQWRTLWLPGIFPALTTGWITAAGGAWNASIVSEYLQDHNPPLMARGLGAYISNAQAQGHFPQLAAAVLAMALFVVFFNRAVWKRISAIAQERYQLLT
ncbi:MAG: ABC transporter permease subunit [Verrucomicrobiota bacterium]